jgi:hypothetical protein
MENATVARKNVDSNKAMLFFGLSVIIFVVVQGYRKKMQGLGGFDRASLNEKIVDSVMPWTEMNPKVEPIVRMAATKIMNTFSNVNIKDVG